MIVPLPHPADVLRRLAFALALLLSSAAGAQADFAEGVRAYDSGDYKAAYKAWLPLAQDDDPAAQRNIALLYRKGLGVSQDFEAAARWYRRAAENGLVRAQVNLANMYLRGQGVPRDPEAARDWYARAALAGDAVGQFNLGLLHERGEGGVRSLPQAMGWYFLAGRSGHPEALRRLAVLVRKDEEQRLARREKTRQAGSGAPPVAAGPAVAAETESATPTGAKGPSEKGDRDTAGKTDSAAKTSEKKTVAVASRSEGAKTGTTAKPAEERRRAGEGTKNSDTGADGESDDVSSMARTLLTGLITRLTTIEPAEGTDRHDGIGASAVERDEPDLDAAGSSVALAAGQEALREGRYGQARDLWLPPARDGVAEARYRLGKLYAQPGFAQANPVDQYFWLTLAARQGHIGASIARGELSRRLDQKVRGRAEDRLKSWDEDRTGL